MKYRTIVLLAIVLLLALVLVSTALAKEEEVKVETVSENNQMDYEEIHNHPQTVLENPMAPPKEVDDFVKKDLKNQKKKYQKTFGGKSKRDETLLDKGKDFLTDQWKEGEKLLSYPWRRMNRWMHSMFDRDNNYGHSGRRGRRATGRDRPHYDTLQANKQRDEDRYSGPMYPYSRDNYRYDDDTSSDDSSSLIDRWYNRPWSYDEEEDDMVRWPSLMMERPMSKWLDYFKDQWSSMVPFHSRFDKIASSVNEKDDKFVFKVVNIPEQLRKKDLIVKLSKEGGRDVLDIFSKFETKDEKDFFEKKYIFPGSVDKKSIRAKFDDKERILTVEVYKAKEDNLINVPIE